MPQLWLIKFLYPCTSEKRNYNILLLLVVKKCPYHISGTCICSNNWITQTHTFPLNQGWTKEKMDNNYIKGTSSWEKTILHVIQRPICFFTQRFLYRMTICMQVDSKAGNNSDGLYHFGQSEIRASDELSRKWDSTGIKYNVTVNCSGIKGNNEEVLRQRDQKKNL